MEIQREIEARDVCGEDALGDGLFQQAYSFLLRPAGDAHEKAQDPGDATERVYVIVVKTEAQVGVGEIGVQSLGAQEVFASAHSGAGRVAIFGAQSVKPRRRGV